MLVSFFFDEVGSKCVRTPWPKITNVKKINKVRREKKNTYESAKIEDKIT